jgi:hypothetical protein
MNALFVRASVAMMFAIPLMFGALTFGAPTSAWANGKGFFEELEEDEEDVGPPYFGFVKEPNGKFMPDATIVATIKSMNSSVTVRTDVQGHFRIPGFSKSIDPKEVDITCSKDGYKQVNRSRRPSPNNGPIEVTCTLAKL